MMLPGHPPDRATVGECNPEKYCSLLRLSTAGQPGLSDPPAPVFLDGGSVHLLKKFEEVADNHDWKYKNNYKVIMDSLIPVSKSFPKRMRPLFSGVTK